MCRAAWALAAALLCACAWADAPCRIAYDLGSSGIRAGSTAVDTVVQADIDYLGPLLAGRGLEETVAPTRAALRELAERGGFPAHCQRVGGGFSAWRLALERDSATLADILARIAAESGVAVLAIPQGIEGAYSHLAARRALGSRFRTSHVLDIGGGSLQIAGERSAWGALLGQKAWQRELCRALRVTDALPCALQPMTREELATARALAAALLGEAGKALPETVSLTAISRPVTRGILPAVARLEGDGAVREGLARSSLATAIDRLAGMTPQEMARLVGGPERFAPYLLSDMLLVEGVLIATGGQTLQVAETDLTNLPGLLADDHAFAWGRRHACYLARLRREGLDAYFGDPADCSE